MEMGSSSIIGMNHNKAQETKVKRVEPVLTNLTIYCRQTPTKPTTQWRAKAGVLWPMVGTYRSMETETAKTDDTNVIPRYTDCPIISKASSVPQMIMSSNG